MIARTLTVTPGDFVKSIEFIIYRTNTENPKVSS